MLIARIVGGEYEPVSDPRWTIDHLFSKASTSRKAFRVFSLNRIF